MCTTGFTMEGTRWAEPLHTDRGAPGALAAAAREFHVWVLAGLAIREESPARLVNAAVLFDPLGSVAAIYRKQRLFAYSGEHEVYAAGEGPVIVTIEGARLGLFICYDLRFPELFRAVATEIDAALLIANWPERRRAHWDVLTRARAIENQCYIVAGKRPRTGGGGEEDGGAGGHYPGGGPPRGGGGGQPPRPGRIEP